MIQIGSFLHRNELADVIGRAIEDLTATFGTRYPKGAEYLQRLEAVEKSLKDNAKIVVPANTELVNVIGEMAGILPIKRSS